MFPRRRRRPDRLNDRFLPLSLLFPPSLLPSPRRHVPPIDALLYFSSLAGIVAPDSFINVFSSLNEWKSINHLRAPRRSLLAFPLSFFFITGAVSPWFPFHCRARSSPFLLCYRARACPDSSAFEYFPSSFADRTTIEPFPAAVEIGRAHV